MSSYFNTLKTAVGGAINIDGSANKVVDKELADIRVSAPNAIEWIVGRDWCNVPSTYKMWRQYECIRDVFQLRCPICNSGDGSCWGKTQTELEDELLLVWSEDFQEDVCPKCNTTRSQLTEDEIVKSYNMLHAVVGMRSGKSVMAGLIGTYVEHKCLSLAWNHPEGLQGYLDMPAAEQLEITFLASTDTQSFDTIWAKYRNYRAASPWFRKAIPWIKGQETSQATPPGMKPWRYDEGDKRIRNEMPGVRLTTNSLNSNSGGIVGRTRIGSFADEISRMKQTESAQSASEIYRGLENSLRTVRSCARRGNLLPWLGLMVSVSSPISDEDKGMELLRIGQSGRVKGMMAIHSATWNFNPLEPREHFDDEFAKDPVGAERDFGAHPPKAAHPLIHDEERFITSSIDHEAEQSATLSTITFDDDLGQSYVAPQLDSCSLVLDHAPRYVACDAGKNFDAFAIACAHGEQRGSTWVTVFDFVYRIVPPKGTEVHFDSFYDVLGKLRDKMPIVQVEFDRWNSIHLIQKLRQLGVRSEQVSTKTKDFLNFAQDAMIGRVALLPPTEADESAEPPLMSGAGVALYELQRLERDPVSDKVFNPRKGERRGYNSDDTAQVIVHCHKMIQGLGYTKKAEDRTKSARRARAEAGSLQWEGQLHRVQQRGGTSMGRGW